MTDPLEDKIRQAMTFVEEKPPTPKIALKRIIPPLRAADAKPDAPEVPEARRPIATRNSNWAKWIAQSLVNGGTTPNQISVASMAAAAVAFLLFWGAGSVDNAMFRGAMLVVAALAVQARLMCNLLDGMVAIEGGKQEPDGPFWNEFPDRVADILILGGMGFAAGSPALGMFAAALAVFTAYIRELGRANGAPSDFSGPMAKQHRMAVVTGAALLAALWPIWGTGAHFILWLALWVIVFGTAATVALRAWTLIEWLRSDKAG